MRENTSDYNRPPPLRPRSDEPQELSFDDDDYTRDGKVGDLRSSAEIESEFPDQREREAGLSGAASPDRDRTADDLTPETLLDEDAAHGAWDDPEQLANDQTLREVGANEIGGGVGLDEEEQALLDRRDIDLRDSDEGT